MKKLLSTLLSALLVLPATAGTIRFDRDGLNARSSLSFRGTGNVLTTVPKGTTGDVLERWELPSGNFGVKLKVTSLGSAGTTLKEGEEIWVYYHKDSDRRRVALLDDDGKEVKTADDPDGKWAVALSSFKTRRQENSADQPCTSGCGTSAVSNNGEAPVVTENLPLTNAQEIVEAVEEVTEAVDEAPVLEFGEQEMLSYVDSIVDARKKGPLTAEQKETNRLLVRTILEESKSQKVPVELALALLQAESEFVVKAKSKKSARGLMQIMPATYHGLLKELKLPPDPGMKKIYDPEHSIRIGVYYLGTLYRKYDGNGKLAVQAYNCGPGRMNAFLSGRKKTLPRETRNHWTKISEHMQTYAKFVQKSGTMLASR